MAWQSVRSAGPRRERGRPARMRPGLPRPWSRGWPRSIPAVTARRAALIERRCRARKALAEVCRNRTDRPDKVGTTGFEVLGGHQPACTSALILSDLRDRVNKQLSLRGTQRSPRGKPFTQSGNARARPLNQEANGAAHPNPLWRRYTLLAQGRFGGGGSQQDRRNRFWELASGELPDATRCPSCSAFAVL